MQQNPPSQSLRRLIWSILSVLFTAIVLVIVTFYVTGLLEKDIELNYYETDNSLVTVGLSQLQENLTVYIERLEYKDSAYTALRVTRYVLQNEDTRSLNEPLSFYFLGQSKGRTSEIDKGAVVDINWAPVNWHYSTVPLLKRTDDPGIGPGFTVVSRFPGKSRLQVSLVLDVGKYPDLREMQVLMGEKAGPASLKGKAQDTRTYTLTFAMVLKIVLISGVVSAFVFIMPWMIVNLRLGHYTAGARMWDWGFERLGLGRPIKRFILSDKLRRPENR